jgi:cell division protein FtsZ
LKLAEVNEASTIIQSAAHEDANIIFGAVQDEKMKDEVKITVIATGFKTDHPQRRERVVSSAAAAISTTRASSGYTPSPGMAGRPSLHPVAWPQGSPVQRETPSLDAVKGSVRDVEQDDLDVPAFIRKRGDAK